MGVDDRGIARIAAGQSSALRRHREDQRGGADEDVVKVHVVHRGCDAGGDRFVVQGFRQCVVGLHVPLDDPFEAPIVVLAFLHHDPVHVRACSAVANEEPDHVREPFGRIQVIRFGVRAGELVGLILEQRFHRRFPQRFLRTEVIRDQPAVHAGFRFDLARTDRVVSALREQ